MIALLMMLGVLGAGYSSSGQVLACQLFETQDEVGDGMVTMVDLRLVTHSNERWTFEFADGATGAAAVKWHHVENAQGTVEWGGAGKLRKISQVFVMSNGWLEGPEYLWLNLEGNKPFETPGYGCHTSIGSGQ